MSSNLATVSYIAAIILFILSLGGLSNPESSRRGNLYGMIGMALAVLATVLGPRVTQAGLPWVVGALVAGGAIGLWLARTVKMTQMPELVAFMHSLVGLVAVLVGYASYIDPTASAGMAGAEIAIQHAQSEQAGMTPLVVMTVVALLFGVHMVMAIGGADMPVVVSMLNSYSGWAAAATGFMLSNDLLIVTGALVG